MIDNILELLIAKKELFNEYKQLLIIMLDCSPTEMTDYSPTLDIIREKVDKIDIQIKSQCNIMGKTGDEILIDIKNKSKREELNDERKQVYDISQSIYNIISSTNSTIQQIKLKAKHNMDETMGKIKDLTESSKGIKYLKAVDSSFEKGTFLNIKK